MQNQDVGVARLNQPQYVVADVDILAEQRARNGILAQRAFWFDLSELKVDDVKDFPQMAFPRVESNNVYWEGDGFLTDLVIELVEKFEYIRDKVRLANTREHLTEVTQEGGKWFGIKEWVAESVKRIFVTKKSVIFRYSAGPCYYCGGNTDVRNRSVAGRSEITVWRVLIQEVRLDLYAGVASTCLLAVAPEMVTTLMLMDDPNTIVKNGMTRLSRECSGLNVPSALVYDVMIGSVCLAALMVAEKHQLTPIHSIMNGSNHQTPPVVASLANMPMGILSVKLK